MDEAMERAWQRRADWPAIGREAARRVRERVPPDPAADLTGRLVRVAEGLSPLAPSMKDEAAGNGDAAAPADEGRRQADTFSVPVNGR